MLLPHNPSSLRIFSIACFLSLAAYASAADAPPPSTSTSTESMKALIAEVKGLVQVRADEKAPWRAAKAGDEVGEGAEFRTGPRSSVTCTIPPDQVLTLDRLGTVKIAEAIRNGNKLKTDLIMKYGRTHYEIEAAGMEHESTIQSPSSTLAVRGTSVSLYDQPPFTPVAESFHGRAAFRNAQRQLRFGGTTPTQVANNKSSAADTALASQAIAPTFSLALTGAESRYVADQPSRSATLFFDRRSQITVIEDGPPPPTDAQLNAEAARGGLPGKLDIVIRWSGNANFNLNVGEYNGTDPNKLLNGIQTSLSEFLYPGFGLNHTTSGGTIPYDNRGGKNGGMEIAYWNTPPVGIYGISAIHASGAPSLVTFNTFLNGKPLDNLTTLQVDSTGNPTFDANGNITVIKNTQITRPVSNPSKPSGPFGPTSGVASVLEFIPPIPSADDPVPVEPPVTFDPFPTQNTPARATPAQSHHAAPARSNVPTTPSVAAARANFSYTLGNHTRGR